jgi:hypothetical protein
MPAKDERLASVRGKRVTDAIERALREAILRDRVDPDLYDHHFEIESVEASFPFI